MGFKTFPHFITWSHDIQEFGETTSGYSRRYFSWHTMAVWHSMQWLKAMSGFEKAMVFYWLEIFNHVLKQICVYVYVYVLCTSRKCYKVGVVPKYSQMRRNTFLSVGTRVRRSRGFWVHAPPETFWFRDPRELPIFLFLFIQTVVD